MKTELFTKEKSLMESDKDSANKFGQMGQNMLAIGIMIKLMDMEPSSI